MSTILIALAGTAAAAVLTWFFCIRPMRHKNGATGVGCGAADAPGIEDEIRAAQRELARLQQPGTTTAPAAPDAASSSQHGS